MSAGSTARLREAGLRADLRIMASNGGVATPAMVGEKPVDDAALRPGGRRARRRLVGALSGRRKLITFDIGGTSADIGIVVDGRLPRPTPRSTSIAGFPLLVPMIDIHTIGAGGGSIAYRRHGRRVSRRAAQRRRRAGPGRLRPRRQRSRR